MTVIMQQDRPPLTEDDRYQAEDNLRLIYILLKECIEIANREVPLDTFVQDPKCAFGLDVAEQMVRLATTLGWIGLFGQNDTFKTHPDQQFQETLVQQIRLFDGLIHAFYFIGAACLPKKMYDDLSKQLDKSTELVKKIYGEELPNEIQVW